MQRIWQAVAIILGLMIVVLGGVTAYVFVTRTAGQSPRPTPTVQATPSPVPSASASATATGSIGPGPSGPSSSGQQSPGPSSGSPSPSPTASIAPGPLGAVEFSVEKVGLDDPTQAGALPRSMTFTTYGPGDVQAAISGTTGGNVKLCLYKGSPSATPATPSCRQGTSGLVKAVATGATGKWTVELSNAVAGKRPVTTATITYRTRLPGVKLAGFRFQGTSDQPRNGFRVHLKARADGVAAISGSWLINDATQAFDNRIKVHDLTAAADVVDAPANGESASGGGPVKRNHEYQVDLRNTQVAAGGEVDLDASVSWP